MQKCGRFLIRDKIIKINLRIKTNSLKSFFLFKSGFKGKTEKIMQNGNCYIT